MQFDQALPSAPIVMGMTSVRIADERARFSLRFAPGDLAEARKVTGLDLPKTIGAASAGDVTCACLGPDEWFITGPAAMQATLTTSLLKLDGKLTHSVVDISHRNIALLIDGPQAVELLQVGCPLNLSSVNFPVGRVTRTVFENAQVMIYRTGAESFHVEIWRSFAPYLWTFLSTVAARQAA